MDEPEKARRPLPSAKVATKGKVTKALLRDQLAVAGRRQGGVAMQNGISDEQSALIVKLSARIEEAIGLQSLATEQMRRMRERASEADRQISGLCQAHEVLASELVAERRTAEASAELHEAVLAQERQASQAAKDELSKQVQCVIELTEALSRSTQALQKLEQEAALHETLRAELENRLTELERRDASMADELSNERAFSLQNSELASRMQTKVALLAASIHQAGQHLQAFVRSPAWRSLERRKRRVQALVRFFRSLTGNPVNPLFDEEWYLEQNPDVRAHLIDPYEHYLNKGRFEGRQPNIMFDPSWYLGMNPDVVAAGHEPLEHYRTFGAYEGRLPHALFPWRFTSDELEQQRSNKQTPLGLYLIQVNQERALKDA